MSKIIDRAGSGAPITPTENDSNLDSLHGINQVIAGATHTVDITDQGDTLEFTNAGAVAVTLDSIATILGAAHTSDFHITLIATNAATVATITPNGANSFNTGVATIVLTVDEYVSLETDSTGLIWNVINSSDASQVGGLSASQFLRSDADDVTTGNIAINKASPSFRIQCADEATENTRIDFLDELGVNRSLLYRPAGTDMVRLDARNAAGVAQAAIDITEAGKVNVSNGTLQLAGTDVTSTAAELNILDGVTSTAAELNILDGVTSTTAELNILDGVTSTTAELNILDGVTSTAAEINILDGVTRTAAEINNLSQIVSGTAVATTSGTTATFGSLPSWIKTIHISTHRVSTSGTNIIYVQIGDSGGYEVTGYIGLCGSISGSTATETKQSVGFPLNTLLANPEISGTVTLTNTDGNIWAISGNMGENTTGSIHFSGGEKELTGTLDRIQLFISSNTFDNGSFNIIYKG